MAMTEAQMTLDRLYWAAYNLKLNQDETGGPVEREKALRPAVREALRHNSRKVVREARRNGSSLAAEDLWDAWVGS